MLLGLHVVVAVGLAAGAVLVIRATRGGGDRPRQLARSGAVLIGLTVIAGVMTVITKNNWWSYAMAAGFIASVLLYGSLLVRAQSPAPQPGNRADPGPRAVGGGYSPTPTRTGPRIGMKYQQIPVNAPAAPGHSYSTDGAMRIRNVSDPVYAPNSKGGPQADSEHFKPPS